MKTPTILINTPTILMKTPTILIKTLIRYINKYLVSKILLKKIFLLAHVIGYIKDFLFFWTHAKLKHLSSVLSQQCWVIVSCTFQNCFFFTPLLPFAMTNPKCKVIFEKVHPFLLLKWPIQKVKKSFQKECRKQL